MGMALAARMLTPAQVEEALSSEERLEALVYEPNSDVPEIDVDKAWHGIHWLLTGSAEPVDPAVRQAPRRRRLFRRAPAPAPAPAIGAEALAVLGGEAIGEDQGYGPARLLRPDEVAAIAAALEPLDREALAARVDLAAMDAAGLYPGIWDEEDVYEEYVGPNYDVLRDFYLDAAARGAAVVLQLL